MVCNKTNFIL